MSFVLVVILIFCLNCDILSMVVKIYVRGYGSKLFVMINLIIGCMFFLVKFNCIFRFLEIDRVVIIGEDIFESVFLVFLD